MTSSAALEARDLYRFYRAGDEETLALRGVSLTVEAGEFVAVTGPSGSGKSTLLACLSGLDEPDGGAVFLSGQRLSHRSERERTKARGRGVGVLLQSNNLVPHLTITDNIRLAQRFGGGPGSLPPAQLLASVGLSGRRHARPAQLSGGEGVRAGLAVAVANAPRVLVADEPTGELDAGTEALVLELVREQATSGCAVVVVSHSPAVAAVADRVVRLADGTIVHEQAR
jgi:putative ABC transport system ATP-binding protein